MDANLLASDRSAQIHSAFSPATRSLQNEVSRPKEDSTRAVPFPVAVCSPIHSANARPYQICCYPGMDKGSVLNESRLSVIVGDQEREIGFRVAYPLELARPLGLDSWEVPSGRVELDVTVHNQSRRPAETSLSLILADGRSVQENEPPASLEPGGWRRVRFVAAGLDPLDLLAGEALLRVQARSQGRLHDEAELRSPRLATRLEDRSLTEYLFSLARLDVAVPGAIRRAQDLMMERVRVDWQAAIDADGNPYKRDLKGQGRETALGDLVQSFATARGLQHPDTLTDLAPRIELLADDLPGAHPLLRRQLKKLARRLRKAPRSRRIGRVRGESSRVPFLPFPRPIEEGTRSGLLE